REQIPLRRLGLTDPEELRAQPAHGSSLRGRSIADRLCFELLALVIDLIEGLLAAACHDHHEPDQHRPSVVRIDPEVRGDGGQRSVAADDENASIAGMNPQDVLRLRLVEDHQDEADLVYDDSQRRSARLGKRFMSNETKHLRSLRSKLLITGGGKDAQSSLL